MSDIQIQLQELVIEYLNLSRSEGNSGYIRAAELLCEKFDLDFNQIWAEWFES